MIRHLGTPATFEIASGHLVMLSNPNELAGAINAFTGAAW